MSEWFPSIDDWQCEAHPGPWRIIKMRVQCGMFTYGPEPSVCSINFSVIEGREVALRKDEEYVTLRSGEVIQNKRFTSVGIVGNRPPEYWHLMGGKVAVALFLDHEERVYMTTLLGPVPYDADVPIPSTGKALMFGIDLGVNGPRLGWLRTWARRPFGSEIERIVAADMLGHGADGRIMWSNKDGRPVERPVFRDEQGREY